MTVVDFPNTRQPALPSRLTELALCGWFGQAVPGEVLEYHRGRLALDTDRVTSKLPMDARQELARVAQRALWAFGHGLVHLVQRRLGADDFSYLIIARPRTRPVSAQSLKMYAYARLVRYYM